MCSTGQTMQASTTTFPMGASVLRILRTSRGSGNWVGDSRSSFEVHNRCTSDGRRTPDAPAILFLNMQSGQRPKGYTILLIVNRFCTLSLHLRDLSSNTP